MKFHLITTLDYEIFGDGSGCLDACLLKPTEHFVDVCSQHSARASLFVDALEFKAMREMVSSGSGLTVNIDGVERQLIELVKNGHEIQLHLHPQWLDAVWRQGDWLLDFDKWRIGSLSDADIERCVDSGLAYLHQLLASAEMDSGLQQSQQLQQLLVFRAGGWAIQSSSRVLEILAARGIRVESTVAPGTKNMASGDWYDFTASPEKPYWRTGQDVCSELENGMLWELPIATAQIGRVRHLTALLASRREPGFPEGCSGSYRGPNNRLQSWRGKLDKLFNIGRVMLDFSTLPADLLIEITAQHIERYSQWDGPVPIVAIGHNKNFTGHSADNLNRYFEWVAAQPELQFSSYHGWLAALEKGDH